MSGGALDRAKTEQSTALISQRLRRKEARDARSKLLAHARYYTLMYREEGPEGAGTAGRADDLTDAAVTYHVCLAAYRRADRRLYKADCVVRELREAASVADAVFGDGAADALAKSTELASGLAQAVGIESDEA